MKRVTIMFLRREGEVLLAVKKRGFGEGKWNGAGGKIEAGETPLQAAIRETEEELGVTPRNAQLVGRLQFYIEDGDHSEHDCHVYVATEWEGDPVETEEMRPQWFKVTDIPYDQMWEDDKVWLPLLLEGSCFAGSATFDGLRMVSHDITRVDSLEES